MDSVEPEYLEGLTINGVYVPAELVITIFRYLPVNERSKLKSVNHSWKRIASHPLVYPGYFPLRNTGGSCTSRNQKRIISETQDIVTRVVIKVNPIRNSMCNALFGRLTNYHRTTDLKIEPRLHSTEVQQSSNIDQLVTFNACAFQNKLVSQYCTKMRVLDAENVNITRGIGCAPLSSMKLPLEVLNITTSQYIRDYDFIKLHNMKVIKIKCERTLTRGNLVKNMIKHSLNTLIELDLEITISENHFNETDLEAIAQCKCLRKLSLKANINRINNNTILHLAQLNCLDTLCLKNVHDVTTEIFTQLFNKCNFFHSLTSLSLLECLGITDYTIPKVIVNFRNITELTIVCNTESRIQIGNVGLSYLVAAKKLKKIFLVTLNDSILDIVDALPPLMPHVESFHFELRSGTEIPSSLTDKINCSIFYLRYYNTDVSRYIIDFKKRGVAF